MNLQNTYHNEGDECYDGELDFTCPPLWVQHYKAYVDVGSLVEFILDTNTMCFGRVTSTEVCNNNVYMLDIHQFVNIDNINEILIDELNSVAQTQNHYMDVSCELVQTHHFVRVQSTLVNDIIFVSKKDDVVNSLFPCEGMSKAFIV